MTRLILAVCLSLAVQHVLAQAQVTSQSETEQTSLDIRPIDTVGLSSGLKWAETITAEELRVHAYILASDSLQGRETGTEGQYKAAKYLAQEMSKLGLPRVGNEYSYEQRIAFERSSWDMVRFSIAGKSYRHLRDFYGFPAEANDVASDYSEVMFLGYGIETEGYSDFKNAGDLRGKVVIILDGEPFDKKGISQVTGTADTSNWSRELSLKRAAAAQRGVEVLLVVKSEIQAEIAEVRSKIIDNSLKLGDPNKVANTTLPTVLHISPKLFRELIGKNTKQVIKARKRMAKKGVSKSTPLPTQLDLELKPRKFVLTGSNVLGYIRGRDPKLADEIVVVSAHYDHLGMRNDNVFNGADDNASGTSTVLEITQALAAAAAKGEGPRRSVLTLFVSGEEKGLLGSEFYAANPVFPLANTVADINIDMIGRYDEEHADSSAYIYVIGAGRISPDLDATTRAINDQYAKLELDYTFDALDDPNRFYYRSDHYNFAKNGVPSVFFFSGVHEDYHRITDTPDKLDYNKMEIVGRNAFLIAWNLANRDGKLNRK
ncbi:MAG: M28 family peptidase [Saprospiraceae bacterium]